MASIQAYARPSRLYRYRSLTDENVDDELRAISEAYVFCPNFSEMNDPMEGGHRESAMLKGSRKYQTTVAAVQECKEQFGIASFSEVYNHEPMWAYYAEKFTGICVAYSIRRLLSGLPDDHELIRMHYSETAPILLRNSDPAEQRAKLILSTKTLRWAGEREWRLVRPQRGEATYGRIDAVTRVYMGSRIETRHRHEVEARCRRLKVPLFGMKVDQYNLKFERVLWRKASM